MIDEIRASGLEYLALAAKLLQRARLADAHPAVSEAADLQWWWRTPRRSDSIDHVFWIDDVGPVAAVVLTDWGRAWAFDPIVVPGSSTVPLHAVWTHAAEAIDGLRLETVEVAARDDDFELLDLLTEGGFVADDHQSGITSMDAEDRPDVSTLPEGFVRPTIAQRRRSREPLSKGGRLLPCEAGGRIGRLRFDTHGSPVTEPADRA